MDDPCSNIKKVEGTKWMTRHLGAGFLLPRNVHNIHRISLILVAYSLKIRFMLQLYCFL
ncbi:hypothetical protein MKW92_010492, partial [Papaver armeniacum]